ncbi:MAG: ketoreductase, partial [Gaiellaceae bacterium]|nr:ketoreductase [Gaiellaceae bacterium]
GVSKVVPFADLDAADDDLWRSCIDVNVMGIWHVARAAAPALRRSDNASITNVTSVAGLRPSGSSIPYAVSKVVPFADLEAADDELWRSCLDVNVMGIWHVVRAAAPALRRSGNASITNVTSVAGIRPSGSSIPYAVSKAAANHLTRLLASALAPDIRVNAVAPGFIETPLTDSMPDRFRKGYEETAALGRIGHPDDIADACLFLARSTYTTGEIVVVDGGLSIA